MGAHECGNLSVGRHKNAKEAYKELVNNAKYWRGHDAYNGTISTSDGFNMINKHPRFGTKTWDKFENDTLENTKWVEWNCIELKGAILKKIKEKHGYKGKRNIKAFYFWGLAAS